jgi:D-lactate dehydrogenase
MEVVAYDIQKNPAVEAMGVKYVEIEDALPWADVVSVHVPLLKSTHHFINGDRCVEGSIFYILCKLAVYVQCH